MITYKSKNNELYNQIAKDLEGIFLGYRNFTERMKIQLERLGFDCKMGKHISLYYNGLLIASLSCTPRDGNCGRAALRTIRKAFETNNFN